MSAISLQERGREKGGSFDELDASYEEKRGKTFMFDSDLGADDENEDGKVAIDETKKITRSREEPVTACTSFAVSL